MDINAITARVERTVRKILEEREATPDPNMEPRPAIRRELAERLRVQSECQAAIGRDFSSVLNVTERMDDRRALRPSVISASDIQERRSESALSVEERDAWRLGARWLRGEAGGEVPGGVIAMSKELGVDRLPSLRSIDAELERLEADLATHVERLVSQLDEWDRRQTTAA